MKKKFLILLLSAQLVFLSAVYSQNVAVNDNGALPDTCAILDISSTTKGFLAPRMNKAQRNAIPVPSAGLLIYQNAPDSMGFHYYDGLKWVWLSQSGGSSWNNVATGLPSNNITDAVYHTGNVSIGKNTPGYKLDVEENSNTKDAVINTTHANPPDGIFTSVLHSNINSGANTSGTINGLLNSISLTNNVQAAGVYNSFSGSSSNAINAIQNVFTSSGPGTKYGITNQFYGGGGFNYGIRNECTSARITNDCYGMYNLLHTPYNNFGVFNEFTNSNDGRYYGVFNIAGTSGPGSQVYGVYNNISASAGGTHYGIYSDVQKQGSFSGYFAGDLVVRPGNVGIGTITPHAPLQFEDKVRNRKIVLYEGTDNEHQFSGFGFNSFILRYQIKSLEDAHVFYAAASDISSNELMRIKGNGNVGIGTPGPTAKLQVNGALMVENNQSTHAQGAFLEWNKDFGGGQTFLLNQKGGGNGGIILGDVDNANNITEYMRLDYNGNVGIGTTAPADQLDVNGYLRATGFRCRTGIAGVHGGNLFNFNWNNGLLEAWVDNTFVGNLSITSDRRLKEDIGSMKNDGLHRLMQLKPVSFKYKKIDGTIFNGSPIVQEGFIADELQQVIPSAVNGKKDALTRDGKVQPQTLNLAPVVSVVTKAIQEQQQQIEELKEQISELKQLVNKLNNK